LIPWRMSRVCLIAGDVYCCIITTLLVIGIRESANFNNVMVITKVSVIILFIAIGFMFVKSVNWHPLCLSIKLKLHHFLNMADSGDG